MSRSPRIKIDAEGASRWNKLSVEIDDYPDECPHCHKHGEQIPLDPAWAAGKDETVVMVAMRCPRKACNHVYYAVYHATKIAADRSMTADLRYSTPTKPEPYEVDSIISSISPQFGKIASEAKAAEANHLTEVAGPAYRKALEFLIKDYLIKHVFAGDPDKQDNVRKMLLANVISNYITDERIKDLASRTAWLGNDETHYERVFEQHDLQDLKQLLNLTAKYIEMDLYAAKYTDEMQKRGKAAAAAPSKAAAKAAGKAQPAKGSGKP